MYLFVAYLGFLFITVLPLWLFFTLRNDHSAPPPRLFLPVLILINSIIDLTYTYVR